MGGPDAPWHPVAWDEEIFGVRTARIRSTRPARDELRAALADVRAAGIGVVHLLVDSDADASKRAAEECGFSLVDLRVTLQWDVKPVSPAGRPGVVLRPARAEDRVRLETIARSSYGMSRYYRDGRYAPERCGELYARWVRQCADAPSGAVLVADAGGAVAGFVACSVASGGDSGSIALFGVDEPQRGKGLASLLLAGAQDWFARAPVPRVTVVTQGRNLDALRAYERQGFLTRSVQLWYHLWI
ncbi:MAG: GNAT family N-acetyltransferase [Acidobacteriota bacterium]